MRTLLCLALATALWLPCLRLLHARPDGPSKARALAARHVRLWSDPALRAREVARMRGTNAEWDFMGRTFLVLGLCDLALGDAPDERARKLAVVDAIIDETLRLEREAGQAHFLMEYGRHGGWRGDGRSIFVDGEVALMLGARRLVEEREGYRALVEERARAIVAAMEAGPVLSGESYPDECWTFCNTAALAALRLHDVVDGTDHGDLTRRWVAVAKARLTHPGTGLLVSSYRLDGTPKDGPEGSSIWMAVHCLALVDEPFARDQQERAKRELAGSVLGFAYAREWPRSWTGPVDVDSGPIVPIIDASTASSGLALLGAATFDPGWLASLVASLDFAAFPIEEDGTLRYAASNQVGDAVLLRALAHGPLWAKARAR